MSIPCPDCGVPIEDHTLSGHQLTNADCSCWLDADDVRRILMARIEELAPPQRTDRPGFSVRIIQSPTPPVVYCRGCSRNNPVAPGLKVCADCDLRMEVGRAGSMLESTIRRDALG